MLDHELWLSFDKNLSQKDLLDIENRVYFLKDVLQEALTTELTENTLGNLDLGLHIYLNYLERKKNTNLSPWLIHDAWFFYYRERSQLSEKMLDELESALYMPQDDISQRLTIFHKCMECHLFIQCEADAVVWLSVLDYLAADMIAKIANKKFKKIFPKI